jgi:hypothetical protein
MSTGFVFMQYWLLDYGPTCPTGWMPGGPANDCYRSSSVAVGVPAFVPITSLGQLSVTGTAAAGGMDTVRFTTATNSYATSANDNVLNLASSWHDAEFNIFGDCCSNQANFNSGARMAVRISVNDGTTNLPNCVAASYTGETNNLNVVPPAVPMAGRRQRSCSGRATIPARRRCARADPASATPI